MGDKPLETYNFIVKENGFNQTVIIPKSDDKGYDNTLIEHYTEKTKSELRNKVHKMPKEGSRQELVGLIKEQQEYRRRRQETVNKRYF